MSAFVVALFLSLGTGAWVYSKTATRTGGNTKSALTMAGVVGGGVFIIGFIIFAIILR